MGTFIIVILLILGMVTGFLIGACLGADTEQNRSPLVGSLDFNVGDPEKEFLTLRITEDIDITNPPRFVRMKVNFIHKLQKEHR